MMRDTAPSLLYTPTQQSSNHAHLWIPARRAAGHSNSVRRVFSGEPLSQQRQCFFDPVKTFFQVIH